MVPSSKQSADCNPSAKVFNTEQPENAETAEGLLPVRSSIDLRAL
jgi:hypothetical protein